MKYILATLFMFSVFAAEHEDVAIEDKHKTAYNCVLSEVKDCSKVDRECQLQIKQGDYKAKLQCVYNYHDCFGVALESCPVEQE